MKGFEISEEEKKLRQEHVDFAFACVALEGFVHTNEEKSKAQKYVNGVISLEELVSIDPKDMIAQD